MKIVVIDSGLSELYPRERISGGISIKERSDASAPSPEYLVEEDYTDKLGHGTGVTDLILKNSDNTQLFVINIYDRSEVVSEGTLCAAMEYALEKLDFDIMHISSGVHLYSKKMHDLVRKITCEKHCLLVSAFDNSGALSYPAALPEVIGIDQSMDYKQKDQYGIVEGDVIDIIGSKSFFRAPDLNGKTTIIQGTSFLAAYFTAKISSMDAPLDKKTIMQKLREQAITIYPAEKENTIDASAFVKEIKKAVIFPFNKEIHSLAAFEDTLPFDVLGYYDIKHKFLVGRKICEVLSHIPNEKTIMNIDNLDWDSDFDTLICGHVGEISAILKKDLLTEMLEHAREHNKKVFFFDNLFEIYESYENTDQIYCPYGELPSSERNLLGKMNTPNVPVLAVLGTSSKQGKYTIQLSIKKELQSRGYRVDGLSSEPSGALLGFSETIAFGYGSKNFLNDREIAVHTNALISKIEKKQPDLILSGCQSGTLSRDLCHLQYMLLDQYSFLLGLNPDGIILVVNNYDEEEYLRRTRAFVESVCEGKIFAVVLSNVTKIFAQSIWDNPLNNREPLTVQDVEKIFEKPVFSLTDLDIKKLVDEIEKYYA